MSLLKFKLDSMKTVTRKLGLTAIKKLWASSPFCGSAWGNFSSAAYRW